MLLIMVLVWRKMENKAPISPSGKTIGATLIGFAGALKNGVKAALLATTAMNQQKFMFTLSGSKVSVKAGMGFKFLSSCVPGTIVNKVMCVAYGDGSLDACHADSLIKEKYLTFLSYQCNI